MQSLSDLGRKETAAAFDTMWAIMLALKETSGSLPGDMKLEDGVNNTRPRDISLAIAAKLRNVSFEGLSVIYPSCTT